MVEWGGFVAGWGVVDWTGRVEKVCEGRTIEGLEVIESGGGCHGVGPCRWYGGSEDKGGCGVWA